jgi:hypothetical protein
MHAEQLFDFWVSVIARVDAHQFLLIGFGVCSYEQFTL